MYGNFSIFIRLKNGGFESFNDVSEYETNVDGKYLRFHLPPANCKNHIWFVPQENILSFEVYESKA